MSDDNVDIDVDSDEDSPNKGQFVDKRAHHNALERKRRDHIKESFSGLRDAIPTMQGDKSSRAQILKKASEYISFMRDKNHIHQSEIDSLKKVNVHMEEQIRALEKAKTTGIYSSASEVLEAAGLNFELPVPEISAGVPVPEPHVSTGYEGGSGSDTSEGSSGTSFSTSRRSGPPSATSPPAQGAPTAGIRTIQPGQSLLIAPSAHSANGEPVLKRMKP
eukprot:maker-scaffold62_size438377-snap-gene-0.13 protein:Tk07841 transcript:maker-scaffold62_size438377-snap-gene-0.13-mRNA-1 annotation:"protein max-like isoform 1"